MKLVTETTHRLEFTPREGRAWLHWLRLAQGINCTMTPEIRALAEALERATKGRGEREGAGVRVLADVDLDLELVEAWLTMGPATVLWRVAYEAQVLWSIEEERR